MNLIRDNVRLIENRQSNLYPKSNDMKITHGTLCTLILAESMK